MPPALAPLPALVLLDLNMPGMHGVEVLSMMKAAPNFCRIPVVIMTGTLNKAEIKRCYDLGANSFLVKPASFDELTALLKSVVQYWLDMVMPAPVALSYHQFLR